MGLYSRVLLAVVLLFGVSASHAWADEGCGCEALVDSGLLRPEDDDIDVTQIHHLFQARNVLSGKFECRGSDEAGRPVRLIPEKGSENKPEVKRCYAEAVVFPTGIHSQPEHSDNSIRF